jgi:hypothetical protein
MSELEHLPLVLRPGVHVPLDQPQIPDSFWAIVNACPGIGEALAAPCVRSGRSKTEHDQPSLVMGTPEGPIHFECDQERT